MSPVAKKQLEQIDNLLQDQFLTRDEYRWLLEEVKDRCTIYLEAVHEEDED